MSDDNIVTLLWIVYLLMVGMLVVFPWAVAFFTFARAKYVPTPPERRLVKTVKHFADGHTEEIVSPTEEEAQKEAETMNRFAFWWYFLGGCLGLLCVLYGGFAPWNRVW